MKTHISIQKTGDFVKLPASLLAMSGLADAGSYEFKIGKGVLAVLNARMTAMELIQAAHSLEQIAEMLQAHLFEICGECGECDHCVYDGPSAGDVKLSDELCAHAGLNEGAKLQVQVDRENHRVIISDAGYRHDLDDVPEEVLDRYICEGAALCDLDQHLRLGDIIYGNE